MTGLRLEIAKATVRKIIDTLSDDDFFNVITVSVVAMAMAIYIEEYKSNNK